MQTNESQNLSMHELLSEAPGPFMPTEGAVFPATVARADKRTSGFWLEFGGKTEAFLPSSEVGTASLQVGQPVAVIALEQPLDGEPFDVSLKQALPWIAMSALKDSGQLVPAKILPMSGHKRNHKGVLASVNDTVGFIPHYKLGIPLEEALSRGELLVKVAQVDSVENKLVFDHVAARRALAGKRDERFAELSLGMKVEGRVIKRMAYGAFVDIGGGISDLYGLLRNSDHSGDLTEGLIVSGYINRLDHDSKGRPAVGISTRVSPLLAEKARDKRYDELSKNAVIDGKVHHLVDYGYFLDIGGDTSDLQGLLPCSEHDEEPLVEGQVVKVRVADKRRTPEGKRHVSLSTKLTPEPAFIERIREGAVLSGVVSSTTDYGAFVVLDKRTRQSGLVHISQLPGGSDQLADLTTGTEVTVRVVKIDLVKRRIDLSLKDVPSTAA